MFANGLTKNFVVHLHASKTQTQSEIGLERIKKMLNVCEECNVNLCVENLYSDTEIPYIFKHINHSKLKICFDTGPNYDYKDDARFERSIWIKEFNNLYHEEIGNTISHDKIINVGVGGGNEAVLLFSSCKNIVFVDIAEQGLKRVKQAIPQSKIFCLRAEELTRLKDNVFNVYI